MADKNQDKPAFDNESAEKDGDPVEKGGDTSEQPESGKDPKSAEKSLAKEYGGRDGPEATRYGDWEKNGIISDF
jgi:hypothetical protein